MNPDTYTGQEVANAYQQGFREGVEAACREHGLPMPTWPCDEDEQ